MFFVTHNGGNTVFHVTTLTCELDIFQKVLNFSKRSLTTEEVKELLLATVNGKKFFLLAAEFCELDLFRVIFNLGRAVV